MERYIRVDSQYFDTVRDLLCSRAGYVSTVVERVPTTEGGFSKKQYPPRASGQNLAYRASVKRHNLMHLSFQTDSFPKRACCMDSFNQRVEASKREALELTENFRAVQQAEYNRTPHGYMLHTAKWLRQTQTSSRNQEIFQRMAVITFLAFALESWINFLGTKCFDSNQNDLTCVKSWLNWLRKRFGSRSKVSGSQTWNERLSVENKLKMLCRKFHYQPKFSEPPFQTFKTIKSLRDMFAHGKPKVISGNLRQIWEAEAIKQHNKKSPLKDLDPTLEFTRQLSEVDLDKLEKDTEAMIEILLNASGIGFPNVLGEPNFF